MRLTKIVCTIGPSSSSENILKKMIDSGMDLARLNFSHGNHQSHEKTFNNLRNLCNDLAIGIDISGPKIRLGKLEEIRILKRDEIVKLTTRDIIGKNNLIP
ncbi:MAG: pyruvate kinase, partial [Candidatus Heimdallarchaeota archaeon]|nr:pyruvate kinase [Candidatus Heimdallarchaeota archaeon]MCK4611326.1 pyruvate kinase [Candidatus Heimdallarchaeota archaeon]